MRGEREEKEVVFSLSFLPLFDSILSSQPSPFATPRWPPGN